MKKNSKSLNSKQSAKSSGRNTLHNPIHRGVSSKRILMLQRRINTLLNEQSSWEEKNKNLSNSLKAEQLLTGSLRKESFHWQQEYYESMITLNSYKVNQTNMVQALKACLREIDGVYPHMVGLSDSLARNKRRVSDLLSSLPSSEHGMLPRQLHNSRKVNEDFFKKNENPTKHRVGPMVKGLLIAKPKIMLERLMIPQPQDHSDPVNTSLPIGVDPPLTSIPEENEHEADRSLGRISIRPKRRKLGTWRVRRQEQIDKERERDHNTPNKVPPSAVAYDVDSSDSECNPPAVEHMEPVVRFKDVTRLLQNTSILKVDAACGGEATGGGSSTQQADVESNRLPMNTLKRKVDDPLEGSSWMYNNHLVNKFQPLNNERKKSSLYKSDSSEDDEHVGTQNVSNIPTMNSLMIQNQSYTLSSKKHSRSSTQSSNNSSNNSPNAEPDSTINIDVSGGINSLYENSSTNGHKSSSFSCASNDRTLELNGSPVSNFSPDHSSTNTEQSDQRFSIKTNSLTVRLSKVPVVSKSSLDSSNSQSLNRRRSSLCDNCSPAHNSPEVLGKRARKPKSYLYPGEEETVKPQKAKVGKKSLTEKTKHKRIPKLKKRSSTGVSVQSPKNEGSPCNSTTQKRGKLSTNEKNSPKKKSSSVYKISKKKKESTEGNYTKKSKTSSLKKSISTPRSSSIGQDQALQGCEDASRGRRNRVCVSYKESPLNVKMRRT